MEQAGIPPLPDAISALADIGAVHEVVEQIKTAITLSNKFDSIETGLLLIKVDRYTSEYVENADIIGGIPDSIEEDRILIRIVGLEEENDE